MNTKNLLRRARKLFDFPDVPPRTARHNRHAWVRSVRMLGDRWLLAKHVQRISHE